MTTTGGAGGATADNASSELERCTESLGTLAVDEDQAAPWYHAYYSRYPQLDSTTPVLRMMIQQSNCFVVVERGRGMNNMMNERALQQSGEMRSGSKFGKGQMVAADYTMIPSIQFSQKGTGGMGGALGGLFGNSAATALAISPIPRRARYLLRPLPIPTTRWYAPCAITRHRPSRAALVKAAPSR